VHGDNNLEQMCAENEDFSLAGGHQSKDALSTKYRYTRYLCSRAVNKAREHGSVYRYRFVKKKFMRF